MSTHRGVKFPKPPGSSDNNPLALLVMLALALLACYVVASWNQVTAFLNQK